MFPERLRALRKGQKITLKELAEHLNENLGPDEKPNTASQIGNWERGIRTPSYIEARKLAEFFDVSLDFLTGKTDRDDFDLAKLFFTGKNLTFNHTALSKNDRYEIYNLIEGYLKGRDNRLDTDQFYGNQEQLNLKLK
ncbi:XRE family transcriptional regulator [Limosilactobacillus frumenti DSM 13145]|uniref:XRE family transcriptional regulator n=1 Tax=Limosilactobacillus frumenti DSM 13145 TaxID=1423746 RepID=A0A0R1P4U5_9LACO|nr:helix-turn-helix transcriptional regulator [Limosilactobacillus frumenti]KRL27677.1 XRE family transcriptional regulator [Limosilactobacillus frumenti DSM 13145]MBA2913886.1 helix-turn-helix transcriptional regulator [Limosilactobacillus frumenti]QFG73242.1 helix-turn-helix transcriptional regulator [Limosilactobacillus frumenti]